MIRIEPRVQGVRPQLRELFQEISPSTIGHFTDFGFLKGLQPLYRPIQLLGNAVTVRIPHLDGSAIRHAMDIAEPEDVLVVDMSGDDERACWGEFWTYAAINKRLAGVVISGCVTDVRRITGLGFPIFSKGISALTTRSLNLEGEVNTPVSIGGVNVQPGHLVAGDDDGLFVIDPNEAEPLAYKALEKQKKEHEKRQAYGYQT